MSTIQNPWSTELVGNAVVQGVVQHVAMDDIHVCVDGASDEPVVASLLHTNDHSPLRLVPGDTVLVWCPGGEGGRAVVVGRVGQSNAAPAPNAETAVPDTMLLEAREQLTLRVGDGSITIRADGKILIKGVDLVSHAQRTNRIKGGAVAIN